MDSGVPGRDGIQPRLSRLIIMLSPEVVNNLVKTLLSLLAIYRQINRLVNIYRPLIYTSRVNETNRLTSETATLKVGKSIVCSALSSFNM